MRYGTIFPGRGVALILAVAAGLHAQLPSGLALKPVFGTDGANKLAVGAVMRALPGKPGHFVVGEMATGGLFLLAPTGDGHHKTPFANIDVYTRLREPFMGLLGLAFHPRFAVNRKYYVKYGRPDQDPPRQIYLDEREAAEDFLKDSGKPPRRILVMDNEGSGTAHTGGSPVFGPDGFLYMSYGDMGRRSNGQNLENLMAKMIRIDVDAKDPGLEYAIPGDNPFVNHPNPKVRREIFAYGLRTTWRFSFDRLTGELYGGDIGEKQYDEVNIVEKGGNYGWSLKEGAHCYSAGTCDGAGIKEPLAYLQIPAGSFMCFVGGHVYRADPSSAFYGVYLFADWDQRKIYALKKGAPGGSRIETLISTAAQKPIDMEMDAQGNLYMLSYQGIIYKLEHPELKEAAVAAKPRADRARLALAPQVRPGWSVGDWSALAGVFALDGTRLGALQEGRFRGPAAPPQGLVILKAMDP